MAGAYGTETVGGRYRLSFTVGGLLAEQGRIIASMAVEDGCLDGVDDDAEVGARVAAVRARAVDDDVLSVRTRAANVRMVREVVKRLSALTVRELRHLAAPGVLSDDRRALMWTAMCRYYAFVGEFAEEVLRDRFLLGYGTVDYADYDRFLHSKAMWHPELEELSPATAAKLRSNVFKAMFEAALVDKVGNTLRPALLGRTVTGILEHRPESFRRFPMVEG